MAGFFCRDGRPVSAHSLPAVFARLGAPDAPEIVASLRIDNRADLLATLALPPETTDAEIGQAAYGRWGTGAPAHLIGDFAWALWDARRHQLVCARDPMGVRPFYYHLSPTTFAFASELGPLLALPGVSRRLDEVAVANRLMGFVEDAEETLYADVRRLPPGRVLTVTADRVEMRTPWALDPDAELTLASDGEYEERFRSTFVEAVRSRLQGAGAPGALLSGGLDSSSITCVAQSLLDTRLPVFTGVFDTARKSDERVFSEAVARHAGVDQHVAQAEAFSPLDDWDGSPWRSEELVWNPQIAVSRAVFGAAEAQGVETLLDGVGGDFVVSYGVGRIPEMARRGKLSGSVSETAALAQRLGVHLRPTLGSFLVRPLLPQPVGRVWRSLTEGRGPEHLWEHRTPLRADTVDRLDLRNRIAEVAGERTHPARTQRRGQWLELTSGRVPLALEGADRTTAVFGIEPRYPFLDRRLVELCLALPPDQKFRSGWTRAILRHSLQGILPEEVCWRSSKASLQTAFRSGLNTADRTVLDGLVSDPGPVAEWVDRRRLEELYARCRAGGANEDWFALWRVAVVALWLTNHG